MGAGGSVPLCRHGMTDGDVPLCQLGRSAFARSSEWMVQRQAKRATFANCRWATDKTQQQPQGNAVVAMSHDVRRYHRQMIPSS